MSILDMRSATERYSADGRQFRQPITCDSAVAGGGITSKKWTKVTLLH